jgi:hypothetical protein
MFLSQNGFLRFSSQRINPFIVFGFALARAYYYWAHPTHTYWGGMTLGFVSLGALTKLTQAFSRGDPIEL